MTSQALRTIKRRSTQHLKMHFQTTSVLIHDRPHKTQRNLLLKTKKETHNGVNITDVGLKASQGISGF